MGQTVQGLFANENPSIVAMCRSVEKVVIDVAVEDFQPLSIKRKTQSVAVIIKSRFIQAYDHHDVSSRPLDPAMESQDSIVIGRSRSRVHRSGPYRTGCSDGVRGAGVSRRRVLE